MSHEQPSFKSRIERALASPTMGTALERAMMAFRFRREFVFMNRDFEAMRDDLVARKSRAIEQLPELIQRFKDEAGTVGADVHFATTAEDARRIVGDLLRERGVKLAVKSKSMVTEEIELNPYLEAQGVRVVETDLGEWIVQLAGERPSHLIAPAIHKTREEIAALFRRELGVEVSDDPWELVKVARQHLRQYFIDADVGITGANIAIAETGTLVIVTNEGNGRLVSTLPPVHIAVLGIEKIVPSLDDATAILKLLPGSAGGQKITTYVSFITGPSLTGDIELTPAMGVHGPRELHIVLLDNGRSAIREDAQFREILRCIRCSACANVCPPFRVVGGHAFGHIYNGPIGLLLTAAHHGLDHAAEPQTLCASCNACETICPAGIPIPSLILELRRRVVEKKGLPAMKRAALKRLAEPASFDRWTGIARLAQRPFSSGQFMRSIPFGGDLTRWRSLPAVPRKSLRDRLRHLGPDGGAAAQVPAARIEGSRAAGLTVAYFAGCITDRLYPEMGEAIVKVLQACGVRVVFPSAQSCCGLPAINAGDWVDGARMARQTIEALEPVAADYVVSGSASCVVTMGDDYRRLFADEPAWRERAAALAARVMDFTTFLERVAQLPARALATAEPGSSVTYHDSCQSHNCLHLKAEPRQLLKEVMGFSVVEMEEPSTCCGFGGGFSVDHPRIAERITRLKMEHVHATNAPVVVTDNPGCILHLRGSFDAAKSPVKVLHLAELMAERVEAQGK